MTTAQAWLEAEAIRQTRAEAEKVERIILDHFGSAERALYLNQLFPGRYLVKSTNGGPFNALFGSDFGPPGPTTYELIDKLRPNNGTR